MRSVRVPGLGGSLRDMSTSRTALQVAPEGAAASGADVELIWVRDLGLPLYTDEHAPPSGAHRLAETMYQADALIWSSPTYHGSVSGSFKNALDWLILLAGNEPPNLSNKPIGLVTTAGGVQGLQAVNTMDFIARSLRGWSVPLVLPVAQSWQSFDPDGNLKDEAVASQLRKLGAEVVRAARQFQADGTCDYAEGTVHHPVPGRLPAKARASSELRSSQWASSATTRTGELSERSDSKVSTATPVRSGSGATGSAARPSAPSRAWACRPGRPATLDRTGRRS
jgi:FMN reductase